LCARSSTRSTAHIAVKSQKRLANTEAGQARYPKSVLSKHHTRNAGKCTTKLSIGLLGEKEMEVCSWGLVVSITKC
jgi:hypothetical protein